MKGASLVPGPVGGGPDLVGGGPDLVGVCPDLVGVRPDLVGVESGPGSGALPCRRADRLMSWSPGLGS